MKLNVLKISDVKAGHITITDGVIDAIKQNSDIDITTLTVKLRAKFLIPILKFIIHNQRLNQPILRYPNIIKLFYKGINEFALPIDIIISTGGDTSFLNIWLSQLYKAKNIYCSSLRGISAKYFSLIITTEDIGVSNSIVLEMAPVKINLNDNNDIIDKFSRTNNIQKDVKYYVLMIGGNGAGYKYNKNDFKNLIEKFMYIVQRDNAKALITTSRRTGLENEYFIKDTFSKYQDDIAYEVYFNQKPQKVVSIFLSLGSVIFVTEESGSMITEAVLAKKPVFTVQPLDVKPQPKYELFLYRLFSKHRIKRLEISKKWQDIKIDDTDFDFIKQAPIEILSDKLQSFLKDIK